MSQKVEKPSLSGHRLKTRKRDEKEKYDPSSFRDAIIQGLTETDNDLDQVAKYLDLQGGKLDFRRYADVLFDILFAGGQLAPGGSIIEDSSDTEKLFRTKVCVFQTEDDKLRDFFEVFHKLLRRYKYLERSFEDALKKILYFMKGFKDDEKRKLAIITGMLLGNSFCSAKVLSSLFEEHLVKDGVSLDFAIVMFKSWLAEKDMNSIITALKKAQLENKLLELFPANKRDQDVFVAHFKKIGLAPIADFQEAQRNFQVKVELKKHLTEMMKDEDPPKEMVAYVLEHMQKHNLKEQEVTILVWNTIMASVEWNKKEELVAEQALKHLRMYSPLVAAVAKSGKAELSLLVKIQEYCYDNMNFMKSFQKIVVMLYKTEVLREEVILKWFKDGHSTKGKSVFLEQMKKFVEWLENASEESEDEED
ncbi:eIF5-mimic protein 2-like [Ostrea edulis]|uniref:eIF5-mimic protein 2-like n=1 Tax=Ostrea edulis TaxID=37623 RepID=UPI0020949C77|nr:eIF5-mimic protein 2-like [Ostrea edulis]